MRSSDGSVLSEATESALELRNLLRLIVHLAACDLGRGYALDWRPAGDEEELWRSRRHYEEASRLVAARPLVPFCERPFTPLLKTLASGGQAAPGPRLG